MGGLRSRFFKPFGFVPFYAGPGVGGDCIPIDPFYFSWKGRQTNGPSSILEQAGYLNHKMPDYVVEKTLLGLSKHCKCIAKSKILVLCVTYKKDINIVRYSSAYKIIEKLQETGWLFPILLNKQSIMSPLQYLVPVSNLELTLM